MPTVMCSESASEVERLVEPAARQVERVAGPQGQVEGGGPGLAERGRVPLLLQRQLEQRLVDEPAASRPRPGGRARRACRGGREALRAARRVVRVRLRGVAELGLQRAAELSERRPVVVQRLEDDRRALGERRGDAVGVGRSGELGRPPGNVRRILRERDLRAGLDQAEAREAQAAGADQPLDVSGREQVVEATLLPPRDDERLLLPVPVEELVDRPAQAL